LTSRIKEFVALYPNVEVSLVLADTELDLSMREADAAIRMQPPRQPDLIQRPLMQLHYHLYGSSDYIKEMGMPKTGGDLDEHRLVVYGEDANPPVADLNWVLKFESNGIMRSPVLQVNSIYGIFRAVQSGLGIAALPDYMCRETENLVRILPEMDGPSVNAFFVYPEELRKTKRINVLRDFLINKVREETF
jgi:DNA-binding transcriptional LysR family regulator